MGGVDVTPPGGASPIAPGVVLEGGVMAVAAGGVSAGAAPAYPGCDGLSVGDTPGVVVRPV